MSSIVSLSSKEQILFQFFCSPLQTELTADVHRSPVEQHWSAWWQVSFRGSAKKQACSRPGDGWKQHTG